MFLTFHRKKHTNVEYTSSEATSLSVDNHNFVFDHYLHSTTRFGMRGHPQTL